MVTTISAFAGTLPKIAWKGARPWNSYRGARRNIARRARAALKCELRVRKQTDSVWTKKDREREWAAREAVGTAEVPSYDRG